MTDVFIIGKGPAGISASLYTARAGFSTIVTGFSAGSLGKAEKIENYYGLAEPVTGLQLYENGILGAQRLGVTVLDEEVLSVSYEGNFKIETENGQYESEVLIVAAGAQRKAPPLKGLKEFEGAGVSYCAVCDAFFSQGRRRGSHRKRRLCRQRSGASGRGGKFRDDSHRRERDGSGNS